MEKDNLIIRLAERKDIATIIYFINLLAEYEKLADSVVLDNNKMENLLFVQKAAEVVLLEISGLPIGFALFFSNFSTFVGKPGLYLEDLYILPEHRNKGYGKQVIKYLAKIALTRDYGRLELSCLDWNESSISFYKQLGAQAMDQWTVYRLDEETLKKLAD